MSRHSTAVGAYQIHYTELCHRRLQTIADELKRRLDGADATSAAVAEARMFAGNVYYKIRDGTVLEGPTVSDYGDQDDYLVDTARALLRLLAAAGGPGAAEASRLLRLALYYVYKARASNCVGGDAPSEEQWALLESRPFADDADEWRARMEDMAEELL